MTNLDLWDTVRDSDANFANVTSKGTAELFTARGFEEVKTLKPGILNDFFMLSIRVFLKEIRSGGAKDVLADQDFGLTFDQAYGGVAQTMRINPIPSVSPLYDHLTDGQSVDQQKVRKPKVTEAFLYENFNYYNWITIPDEALYKDMWISGDRIPTFVAGIAERLNEAFILQKYTAKMNAINEFINSESIPLRDTQKLEITVADKDALTSTDIRSIYKAIKNVKRSFESTPTLSMYNKIGFQYRQNVEDLRLLIRPGFLSDLEDIPQLERPVGLDFNIKTVVIENFGGMIPYVMDGDTKNYLQPIYDGNGERVAYVDATVTVNGPARFDESSQKWIVNVTSGGTTADTNQTVTECSFEDPNADIQFAIADKAVLQEILKSPYSVNPSEPNRAGLYQNLHATSPYNTIGTDASYNFIAGYIKEGT